MFTYGDTTETDPLKICNLFADYFKSTYPTNTTSNNIPDTLGNTNNNNPTFNPISTESVQRILQNVDEKNGGPDGILNIFLKKAAYGLS